MAQENRNQGREGTDKTVQPVFVSFEPFTVFLSRITPLSDLKYICKKFVHFTLIIQIYRLFIVPNYFNLFIKVFYLRFIQRFFFFANLSAHLENLKYDIETTLFPLWLFTKNEAYDIFKN